MNIQPDFNDQQPMGDTVEVDGDDAIEMAMADGGAVEKERVLFWWPQNGTPALKKAMTEAAGNRWPGITLEQVNPKYFTEDDVLIHGVVGIVCPSFYQRVIDGYKKLKVEVMVAKWAPGAPPSTPEHAPKDKPLLPTDVPVPKEPAPLPVENETVDAETVAEVVKVGVADLDAMLGAMESLLFVRAVKEAEEAKSRPRKTALEVIDKHIARITGEPIAESE